VLKGHRLSGGNNPAGRLGPSIITNFVLVDRHRPTLGNADLGDSAAPQADLAEPRSTGFARSDDAVRRRPAAGIFPLFHTGRHGLRVLDGAVPRTRWGSGRSFRKGPLIWDVLSRCRRTATVSLAVLVRPASFPIWPRSRDRSQSRVGRRSSTACWPWGLARLRTPTGTSYENRHIYCLRAWRHRWSSSVHTRGQLSTFAVFDFCRVGTPQSFRPISSARRHPISGLRDGADAGDFRFVRSTGSRTFNHDAPPAKTWPKVMLVDRPHRCLRNT